MVSVGLVLEGGAMRGMYTMGVLDIMMDHHIRVDGLVGVSAGALFGANLFSGQRGRALRYNKKYMPDKRYMSIRSLITTGDLINRDFTYYKLTYELDPFDEAAFEAYKGDFYAVVTNVETGEPEYIKIDNVLEQLEDLRATAALPLVSKIVERGEKKYLDGGVTDSIPVRACLDMGYDKVVVVLTQPADYRKKPMSMGLVRLAYRRYPKLVEALERRHESYNAQCEEVTRLEKEGRIFVIRPEQPLEIGRLERDPDKLQAVYDKGIEAGEKYIGAMNPYLGVKA